MSQLILIRHSQSQLDLHQPARRWVLTAAGRLRCRPLAEALAMYKPARIIASQEPKAADTGRLAAEFLNIPFETAPDLHEHQREHLPILDRDAFQTGVAALFARPDEHVFGDESANQARARFSRAVAVQISRYPGERLGIATHGTVLSLFVAQACRVSAYELWQWLDMPAFVVLDYPRGELLARWKWSPELEVPA